MQRRRYYLLLLISSNGVISPTIDSPKSWTATKHINFSQSTPFQRSAIVYDCSQILTNLWHHGHDYHPVWVITHTFQVLDVMFKFLPISLFKWFEPLHCVEELQELFSWWEKRFHGFWSAWEWMFGGEALSEEMRQLVVQTSQWWSVPIMWNSSQADIAKPCNPIWQLFADLKLLQNCSTTVCTPRLQQKGN